MDDKAFHFIPTFPPSSSTSFISPEDSFRTSTAYDVSTPGLPSQQGTVLDALHILLQPVNPLQTSTSASQNVLPVQSILPSSVPRPSNNVHDTNILPSSEPGLPRFGFPEQWEPAGSQMPGEPEDEPSTLQSATVLFGGECIIRSGTPLQLLSKDERMFSGLHYDVPTRAVEGPYSSVFIDPQCHTGDLQTHVESNPYSNTSRVTHPYDSTLRLSPSLPMTRKPADLPPSPVSLASPPTEAPPSQRPVASVGVIRASQSRRRNGAKFKCPCGQTFTTRNGLHSMLLPNVHWVTLTVYS
ncbi:hypothetical protein VNI00_006019 [Paramarasmius palmivorus]|uniref:Uncharacterized protein n=1 Tax=Paramarasmius palmivorus TaxID=297713 RepID=A0AAW0DG07_9AGAR